MSSLLIQEALPVDLTSSSVQTDKDVNRYSTLLNVHQSQLQKQRPCPTAFSA
jgi:hypothetical protein